jgi:hypothetical protein
MDLREWLQSGKRPALTAPATPSPNKVAKPDAVEVTAVSDEKASQLLAMKDFKDQLLEVRGNEIYCVVCKASIGCEPRLLRQHCFQKQAGSARAEFEKKSEEEKVKLRHYKKTLEFLEAEKRGAVLHKALELNRQKLLVQAEGAVAVRKNLDSATIARRVVVFETLSGVGVPLSKLDDPAFLSLIEGEGPRLGGRRGVTEVHEFVQQRQLEAVRKTLEGRMVGLFGDGSKANYLIEATVARFVSDSGEIQHVCIGLSRIDRSLDGEQLKGIVQLHLDSAAISKTRLMAAITDSAAVNKSMAKHFNWEVRAVVPEASRFANSFPIHHCFSHMITNSGSKWRESMTASVQILSGLKGLRVSDSAKSLFRDMTGASLPDGTENRWFYWVDFVKSVLPHWSALPGLVRRCKEGGYMPKKVAKMSALVTPSARREAFKAGLELQFMMLLGEPLAQATYFLEGDGFLAPFAFSRLNGLNELLLSVARADATEDNEYVMAMRAFANRNPGELLRNVHEDVIGEVWRTRTILVDYWKENVWNEMRFDVQLFKGFSVLDPLQLSSMTNAEVLSRLNGLREAEEVVARKNPSRRFKGVKGFNDNVQEALFAQLAQYRLAAEAFRPVLALVHPAEQPAKLWEWWWSMRNEEGLRQWSLLARIAVLYQPSSAVIERFFSVYKGMTSAQQCREDEETSLVRAQTRYNKGKVGL